ncbi:uncharacterized protein N7515_009047 [Penicillium bovifimosum]|uniref:Uncharacterized protein n=1 Tax=Penicillium bovifimosum TaxID=126998 RepID=A0A9W9KU55_9EURO|nr:uncharacterized protein N7515_009047 [Penicillium bovifimosum]KAJ5121086.1 hypothetical protein N7515_009047 [Penicillium bovifimosum]
MDDQGLPLPRALPARPPTSPEYAPRDLPDDSEAESVYEDCAETLEDSNVPDQDSISDKSKGVTELQPNIEFNMGLQNSGLTQNGATISASGNRLVMVSEQENHLLIPEYPAVSQSGILHRIHLSKSPLGTDPTKANALKAFATLSSNTLEYGIVNIDAMEFITASQLILILSLLVNNMIGLILISLGSFVKRQQSQFLNPAKLQLKPLVFNQAIRILAAILCVTDEGLVNAVVNKLLRSVVQQIHEPSSRHFVDNEAIGRKQSVLAASLKAKRHVNDMVEKTKLAAEEGGHSTWKPADAISRVVEPSQGKNKRNRASAERLSGTQSVQPFCSGSYPHSTRPQSIQPPSTELAELIKEEERLRVQIRLAKRRRVIEELQRELDSLS